MNIKQQIEEWKKVKGEISPWPWEIYDESVEQINNDEGFVATTYSEFDSIAETKQYHNSRFIASAPQKYDQAMQALEEAKELIVSFSKTYEPCGRHEYEVIEDEDAMKWLKKWGFEE